MTDPTNRELLQGEWHALLADPDAVVRAVREMVESGTIEGGKVRIGQNMLGQDVMMPPLANFKSGDYLLVPVSDDGSEA